MASILVYSKYGKGVPLAIRFAGEGHVSKMYIQQSDSQLLKGYRNPTRLASPSKLLDQFDIILCDGPGLGGEADKLRERGCTVIGGGVFNDTLSQDRSYLGKVLSVLYHRELPDTVPKVGIPVEVYTGGWFNEEFKPPFFHTIEKRRFMEGDKGPETETMGSMVWLSYGDKLVTDVLMPLVPLLAKVKYLGPVYVQSIVDLDRLYILRILGHIHFDAIFALIELMKGSLFEFLFRFVSGRAVDAEYLRNQIAMVVRLTLPPYPTPVREVAAKWEGVRALTVPPEAEKHVWCFDTMRNEQGIACVAGSSGILASVSARGDNIREARRRVYRSIEHLDLIPDTQYRYDIDRYMDLKIAQLFDWGWIEGRRDATNEKLESAVRSSEVSVPEDPSVDSEGRDRDSGPEASVQGNNVPGS